MQSLETGGLFYIEYNRKRCIGCGLCASIAPERWIMNEKDGKAILLQARGKGHMFRSQEPELQIPREARECPASAITARRQSR